MDICYSGKRTVSGSIHNEGVPFKGPESIYFLSTIYNDNYKLLVYIHAHCTYVAAITKYVYI